MMMNYMRFFRFYNALFIVCNGRCDLQTITVINRFFINNFNGFSYSSLVDNNFVPIFCFPFIMAEQAITSSIKIATLKNLKNPLSKRPRVDSGIRPLLSDCILKLELLPINFGPSIKNFIWEVTN